MLYNIGRGDLRSRQPPRTYGIWTTSPSYWTDWRALLFKKSHHNRNECDNQYQYVCQRPAAALEASERLSWKGCYSLLHLDSTTPNIESNLMTIDYCSHFCQESAFIGISGSNCYCLDNLNNASRLSNKLCSQKCKANPAQLCGGKGAIVVHQLKVDSYLDVMVLLGGTEAGSLPLEDSTVIMSDGQECQDHGIPDLPSPVLEAGFVSINNSVIVMCGGKTISLYYQPKEGCKFLILLVVF